MLSNSRWIILLCSITIASKLQFVFCNNITILGPHCTDTAGDKTENLNCGSSLEPNIDGGSITLGKLCPGGDRLQLRILRDDINIQGKLSITENDSDCPTFIFRKRKFLISLKTSFSSFGLKSRGLRLQSFRM